MPEHKDDGIFSFYLENKPDITVPEIIFDYVINSIGLFCRAIRSPFKALYLL